MIFTTALGPIDTGEGPAWIAVASAHDGILSSRIASTRDGALGALAATLPRGEPVTCDSWLRADAAKLGWASGPLPQELLESVAVLGVGMMHGPVLRKLKEPSVLVELLTAAAGYARAQPWERFGADEALELRVSGAASGSRWAMSFGSMGHEFGLALYDTRSAFERFVELSGGEDPRRAMEVDGLACLVSLEPGAVTDVMHRAWDTAFEPHFMLMKGGRPQPLRVDDVRLLTAALRALTSVATRGAAGTGVCELLGKRVEVRVEVAAPELAVAERRSSATGPQPHAGHRLDAEVLPRLLSLARSLLGWSDEHLVAAAEDLSLLSVLSLFVRLHDGKTIAARFLETRPPDELRRWVEAHQGGWLSLFEVEAFGAGQVAVHDLLLDVSLVVEDVGLSRSVKPHDVLLLWLVDIDGVTLAAANKDAPLGLGEALEVREELVRGNPAGALSRKSLGTAEHADVLWAAVRAKERARTPEVGDFTNTDEDLIHFGADLYSMSAESEEVGALLVEQPGVLEEEDSRFTLTKLGNALHPSWRRTVIASVELGPKQLVVKANSHRRLDDARVWLGGILGNRVAFLERTSEGTALPPVAGSFDIQTLADGPWMEVLPTLELRSAWVGPGGAGLHATDARTREEARRDAHLAIARHEHDGGLVKGLELRRAIGLSWRGEWLGADSVWLGLGAGIPLSLALQTVGAPLVAELKGDQRTGFSDALRLAWGAWAVAGQRVTTDEATALTRRRLEPEKREKKAKGSALSQNLPRSSPNVEVVLAAIPWAIERTRLLFPLDRRVVMEVRVEEARGMLNCQAMWTAEAGIERTLKEHGYRAGLLPLQRYADLTLDSVFEWRVTPPGWRRELVGDFLRTAGSFGDDFPAEVAARVEIEDELLERGNVALRTACQRLEALSLEHVAAVGLLAHASRVEPALTGWKKGAAFNAAIEALISETGRRLGGRH